MNVHLLDVVNLTPHREAAPEHVLLALPRKHFTALFCLDSVFVSQRNFINLFIYFTEKKTISHRRLFGGVIGGLGVNLLKHIPQELATTGLLTAFLLLVAFHLLVLAGVVPSDIV